MDPHQESTPSAVFRKVLVAVDGSAHAERALEAASELARRCGSELVLFHAIELSPMRADLAGRVDEAARTMYRRVGEELADQILSQAERTAKEHKVERVTRLAGFGDAAKAIDDAARREGVDLIVVGTRGLTGLHGLALGSVAHKITSMASCPVMVVR